MSRRGFTLTELLVATVVVGILGTALTRLVISNSRFVSRQEAQMDARQTARAAMNTMLAELRMISAGGVVAAAAESVLVRMPYAFGVVCGDNGGGWTVVALAPADSLAYARATGSGVARRTATGTYVFDTPITLQENPTGSAAACGSATDTIPLIPGGHHVGLNGWAAPRGSVAYLYETLTYAFRASVAVPGRTGLWRRAGAAAAEEILAPFDAASGFEFLVGNLLTPQTAVPSPLDSIRGLELHLVSESALTPAGASQPSRFDLTAQVRFMNRGAP